MRKKITPVIDLKLMWVKTPFLLGWCQKQCFEHWAVHSQNWKTFKLGEQCIAFSRGIFILLGEMLKLKWNFVHEWTENTSKYLEENTVSTIRDFTESEGNVNLMVMTLGVLQCSILFPLHCFSMDQYAFIIIFIAPCCCSQQFAISCNSSLKTSWFF